MARKSKKALAEDQGKLEEIHDRYKEASDRLQPMFKEGNVDMRYVDGDPWDPRERRLREKNGRPCLSLDEISQYENPVINDIRANKRAAKFSPVGDGANDETARIYGDKWREIEYRSKAPSIAYPNALQNAVWRSFGYCRLSLRHKTLPANILTEDYQPSPELFHQEIWIDQVADPNSILPDPDFQMPDLSDIRYLYVLEQYTREEFQRKFPNATLTSFSPDQVKSSRGWITQKSVQVAEYWYIEDVKGFTVALLEDQQGNAQVVKVEILKELGIPGGWEVKRERSIDVPKVRQCLTNGVEILEKSDWLGIYIPFAGCFGKMFWRDKGSGSERVVHSMTRLARDPAMLYCYYRTTEAEVIRSVPKFPYFYYEGQLSPAMLELMQQSYDKPVVALAVKHTIDGAPSTQALPFPQRQPYEPPIVALEAGAEAARRAVQSGMGTTFLPTEAQRVNDKSGKALDKIDQNAQKGSFHFVDNFNGMIEFLALQGEDLMDKVYVGARDLMVMNDEMKMRTVRINDPEAPNDPKQAMRSIAGRHLVTISVGPSDDSEREQADRFVDTIVGSPEMLQIAGPDGAKKVVGQAVRLKNLGPIGDKIADVYDPQEQGQQPIPPQAQQALQEAGALLQEAMAENEALKQEKAAKQVENESRERIATENNEVKVLIAEMQTAQKDREANLEAKVDLMLKRMELVITSMRGEQQEQHESAMAERGQAASASESANERDFQAREGQANRDAAERQAAMQPKNGKG